jgi:lipoate-protein ligase A
MMTGAPTQWRLLRTFPAQGAWNMAVDEAILESASKGEAPPTLRLYAWSPPCLSLGYAQPANDVNLEILKSFGWEVVRRPTGGRAILHTDELTYSISGKNLEPQLLGSVLESYQRLSLGLLEALHLLGIEADTPRLSPNSTQKSNFNPVCFEVPSNYEITYEGKKLIGSAQARRKSGVLQHGSLPLNGDLTRILDVLNFSGSQTRDSARKNLLDHATTLERAVGYKEDWWIASYAFEAAFKNMLNMDLQKMDLTPKEGRRAFELYNQKYNHQDWTLKR